LDIRVNFILYLLIIVITIFYQPKKAANPHGGLQSINLLTYNNLIISKNTIHSLAQINYANRQSVETKSGLFGAELRHSWGIVEAELRHSWGKSIVGT